MRRVPIFFDSSKSGVIVSELGDALGRYSIGSESHLGYPVREYDKVMGNLKQYRGEKTPLITVPYKADDLSGHVAAKSNNPVVCCRSDYFNPLSLERYLFSSLGKHEKVPIGNLFGLVQTASFIRRILDMRDRAPKELSIPFIGKETEFTRQFSEVLYQMSTGISARHAGIGEIGDSPVCAMFGYMSNSTPIERALETTDSPILLVPPDENSDQTVGQTMTTITSGYRPDAALVLDPLNAALYVATLVGLFHQGTREAVSSFKKKS